MSDTRMHSSSSILVRATLVSFVALAACSPSQNTTDAAFDTAADTTPMCLAPSTLCGSDCVDTTSNAQHCGSCATACPGGQSCVAGGCRTICQPGQTVCGAGTDARCVNTGTDNANCGGCGNQCPAGHACVTGACTTRCPTGQTLCASTCVDTQSNNANCGTCGHACATGQACVTGSCRSSCPTGETMCGTGATAACVSTQTDNANCGTCGTMCSTGTACVGGTCVSSCAAGQMMCCTGTSARCVSVQTDNANCGACGTICASGTMCSAGACAPACSRGLTGCPTAMATYCADVANDPANCGGCGTSCPAAANATPVCTSATCGLVCNRGFADCNGMPADGCETNTNTDASNCGLCGAPCAAGNVCMSGACFPVGTIGGSSCAGIHASNPTAPSGVYPLITGVGASATMWNAYCDMTHAGGGWTLILKVAGNSANFPYGSATWTNATLLGTTSTDLSHTDAKFQGFTNLPFSEVMLAFDATVPPSTPNPNYASFAMPAMSLSLQSVFAAAGPTLANGSGTAMGRNTVLGLDPRFSIEPNCNQVGFNLPGASGTAVRFGVIGNNEADCATNDSGAGLGVVHHTGCSYGTTAQPSAGSACSCGGCTNAAGTVTADPNIVEDFGYLFVR